MAASATVARVAILPWGDVIEDFLGQIGMTLEDFAARMTGGWLFGYIEALRLAGVETTLFCVSGATRMPRLMKHEPTGAVICVLPASRIHRWLKRRAAGGGIVGRVARHLAPYFATPLTRLMRAVRRSGCRAILCQEYEYPRFDACVAAGVLTRVPVFGVFQGGKLQLSVIERWLRPVSMRLSSGLIIGSEGERARVRRRYAGSNGKIHACVNAVDTALWRPEDRREARMRLGLPLDARIAIWHGRIEIRQKGLDVLLRAWEAVCRKRADEDFRLVLVGGGPDEGRFRGMLANPDLLRVEWNDQYVLDRSLMRSYLAAGDVYVFASRHEGFPCAPMEAMACGLPVIATTVPGIAEIVGSGEGAGGVVVEREDAAAMAAQIERFLGDVELSGRWGLRARERAEKVFSLPSVGRQLSSCLIGLDDPNAIQAHRG